MKLNQLIRDFLFLIFALYYILNILYTEGSVYSQICIVIIILISGVYFIKTLLLDNKNSLLYSAWTLLLLLNIIGFSLDFDLSEGQTRDMFKEVLGCMLPFYPFYYFAKKDMLKASHLIRFILIMLPIFIILFFSVERQILLNRGTNAGDVVVNTAYQFVGLIPYVFLIRKNKLLSVAFMLVIIFFIIQGSKRGAIVVGFIGLLMYVYYQMKTLEKNNRILGFFMVIIILIGLGVFTYKTLVDNRYLLIRMNALLQGDTSNRTEIYGTLLDAWYNSENIINLLFGFGFAASLDIMGSFAHNDWLELLTNFGLLGVFVYLFFFYALLKCYLNKELSVDKRILIITITLMWFLTSLFSMGYTSFGKFTQSILLGFLIGTERRSI